MDNLDFRQQADRCRRLARDSDAVTRDRLISLAEQYDERARIAEDDDAHDREHG